MPLLDRLREIMYPDLYTRAEVFIPSVPRGATAADTLRIAADFRQQFGADAAAVTQRYILLHLVSACIVPVMLRLATDSTPAAAYPALRILRAAVRYGTDESLPRCRALEALINEPPLLRGCVHELTHGLMHGKQWNYWLARLAHELACRVHQRQ